MSAAPTSASPSGSYVPSKGEEPKRKPKRPVRQLPSVSAAARGPEIVGGMVTLTVRVFVAMFRKPRNYGPEFASELIFVFKTVWRPLGLTTAVLSFGPLGILLASFLNLAGAIDRMGAVVGIATTREFAPLITVLMVAGVGGTSICADLGARRVREEIDALEVFGVDPVPSLIVPRVLALVVTTVTFTTFAMAGSFLIGLVVVLINHGSSGSYLTGFLSNVGVITLVTCYAKAVVYGTIVAVVSCYMGINAGGGAVGVGRAVNLSVVIAFVAIGLFDYAVNQLSLALIPALSQFQ